MGSPLPPRWATWHTPREPLVRGSTPKAQSNVRYLELCLSAQVREAMG